MAAKPGWENLIVETNPETGEVRMRGTIEDPRFIKDLKKVMRTRKVDAETAMHLMLKKGAALYKDTLAVDGSTQSAG